MRLTCSCRKGFPILPIGSVNLTTGANAMFGTVWDCWEEGGTDILLRDCSLFRPADYVRPMRVVHTSGTASDMNVGDTLELVHDQTNRSIGERWEVVGKFSHTKEGLLEMKRVTGRNSFSFNTFK